LEAKDETKTFMFYRFSLFSCGVPAFQWIIASKSGGGTESSSGTF